MPCIMGEPAPPICIIPFAMPALFTVSIDQVRSTACLAYLHGLLWHAAILPELAVVHVRIEGILDHHILRRHVGHSWPNIRHHATVELLTFKSWPLGRRPTVVTFGWRRGAAIHVNIALLALHLLLLLHHGNFTHLLQLLRGASNSKHQRSRAGGIRGLHFVSHLPRNSAIHDVVAHVIGTHGKLVRVNHAWSGKILTLLIFSHALHTLHDNVSISG